MIKLDIIWLFFFSISSAELVYGFLQGQGFNGPLAFGQMVAIALLVFGILGGFVAERLQKRPGFGFAKSIPEKAQLNIGIGVMVALVLAILANKFIPEIVAAGSVINVVTFFGTFSFDTTALGVASNAFLFSVILIPTAEESFFRGFWANLALAGARSRPMVFVGLVLQALVFVIFHIPAYGWTTALWIIFAYGLIFGAVDEETGYISPGLLAHVGVNFLSWIVATGAVVIPTLMIPGLGQFIGLPFAFGVYAFVRVRHNKPVIPRWSLHV